MNPIQHLENWLDDQLTLIENCTDAQEEFRLVCDYKHIKMNMNFYNTRLNNGHYYHVCQECNVIELATTSIKERLIEHQLCFSCNHWKEISDRHVNCPDEKLIINGKLYSDAGNKPHSRPDFLGHAGHVFTILADNGEQWQTNNLWCGGDIPLKYRQTTMKNNAEFI